VLPAADPRPGSSAPAGRASGRAGLHGEETGPARPLGGGAVSLGGALMMIVCAYIGRCDHTSTNAPDPIRTPHTSFLPVLPAADPRPGSSAPAGRASGRAGLHREEMGPARPLGGGVVALGGALMMIVCAYIGSTSFLPVLPAADPCPESSAPAGRASGRAGLHSEEMGPARPLGGVPLFYPSFRPPTLVPEAQLRRVGPPGGRGSIARRWAPRGLSAAAPLPSEARL
ncbi:hypothetical protein PIB30_104687, partial [Stylosanthes scabra]|nr:hypothetical protein [Stylosanthes scabra]